MDAKLSFAMVLLIASLLILCAQDGVKREVRYEVGECAKVKMLKPDVSYDAKNKLPRACVVVNCCSDEILVERQNSEYVVVETDRDGKLCKCLCVRDITIYDVSRDYRVFFVDVGGTKHEIWKLEGFCGWSTYGECRNDADCAVTGCSSQVCAAKGERVVTTCEWRECYDARAFDLLCRCVEGRCQWSPQN